MGVLPAKDFAKRIETKLPVYGLDVPARSLAHLCLLPNDWLFEDESWKPVATGLGIDRSYAASIRSVLQGEARTEKYEFAFLFSLREGKVSDRGGSIAREFD
jgi:hypothetical protein